MAGTIKGITVEIGGNTGPLDKALQGVNKTSRDLQSELTQVNKLLKLDPTNVDLLNQKQKLLAESVSTTKGKLDTLKLAEAQAQEQFKKGSISEEQYRALEREVVKTEQSLKGLETQAGKSNVVLSEIAAIGTKMKTAGAGISSAGKSMTMGLTVPILAVGAGFAAMVVKATDGADALQQMSDVTGLTAERLQELTYIGSKVDVELDTMTGAQKFLTKAMAAAQIGTKAQVAIFKELGIDAVDPLNGQLRDSNVVFTETIAALGKMTNPTERNAMALKLFGKSAMALNPLIKTGADEIANLTAEAHKNGAVMSNENVLAMDKFSDSMAAMKLSITGAVGKVAAELMPTFEKLIPIVQDQIVPAIGRFAQMIADLIIKFTTLDPTTQKIILGIGAFLLAIGPIVTVIGAIVTAVGFLMSPIGLVVLAIGALIAIGVLLYKNWDTISAFLSSIWNSIATTATNVFNSVATFFANTWNSITATVTNTWNGIGTFFVNLWAGITNTIQNVWNGIGQFFVNIINSIVTFVATTFSKQINDVYVIFLALERIFIGVWEIIKNIFLGAILLIIDLVTGNFTKLKEDALNIFDSLRTYFSDIWDNIKLIFTRALDLITTTLTQVWDGIVIVATTVWNGLKDFFVGLWTSISTSATNAWNSLKTAVIDIVTIMVDRFMNTFNAVLDFFRNLPDNLYNLGVNAFNGLKNGIVLVMSTINDVVRGGFAAAISFITGLPGQALQWGKDFIQGLINGIKSMIGGIGKAVSGVGDTIRGYLHFSTPDVGPLTDYEKWMPDFMSGLAKGIENSKYLVANAVKGLSSDVSIGMNLTPAMAGMGSMGSSTNTTNYGSILHTDKVVINNGMDIQTLAEELSFYVKQKQLGGA